jgi:predicted PurR-regulated permease PerM
MNGASTQHYFLLALLLGAVVIAYLIVKPFFAPLVLGAVFAVVLLPVHRNLLRYTDNRESLSALATVGVSILVVLVPVLFVALQLLKEAQGLYTSLEGANTHAVSQWISDKGPLLDSYVPNASASLRELSSSFDDYARAGASWVVLNIGTAFSSVAGLILDLFIFFITLYYLLRDGRRLRDYLVRLSPLKDADDAHIVNRLSLAVNSVVKGKLAIAAIQGLLAGVGLAIFGVPNPVVWGIVAMVVSLVPPAGTAIVLVPAILYLIVVGSIPAAIGLGVWSLGVTVIDNVLGPILMGGGTEIHPLIVLISVLGGLILFGPVGLFLGPLCMALLLALLSLYSDIVSGKRGVSVPSNENTMSNTSRGFGIIQGVAMVAVLAIIGGAIYLYLMVRPEQTPLPIGEGEVHEEENLTYSNDTYGVSFSYPDNYVVTERDMPGSAQRAHHSIVLMDKTAAENIPEGGEGPPTINVDIIQNNLDKQTPEQWIKNASISNYKLSPDGTIIEGEVAGVPSYTYTWDGLYRGESTVLEHKGNILMFSVTTLTPTDQIRYDFDGLLSSVTLK